MHQKQHNKLQQQIQQQQQDGKQNKLDIPQFQVQSSSSVDEFNKKLIHQYLTNAYLTIILFIIMVIMFVICAIWTYIENKNTNSQKYSFSSFNPYVLLKLGANAGFLVKEGQIYRLVTPIFLHAGYQHFVANTFSIFALLIPIQMQTKKSIFALVFFLGGIQGNLASLYANFLKNHSNVIAVGASTSICAVLGLSLTNLYLKSYYNGNTQIAKKKIIFMIGYLFVISMMPGIDFYGHFGSLIGGMLIGLSFSAEKEKIYQVQPSFIRKIKLISRILLTAYTVFLFSIFFL